jgi:CDP-glycerol glycerophosphotransferase (TagB/SpsB family)
MICNKPRGLVWNDIEDFKKNVGFYDFYEETTAGCEKIYTFEELCKFVEAVSEGRDELAETRERICKTVNADRDGKNAARVVDFIIEKSKL